MKKIILTILFCLICNSAYGAISADCVWELRSTATSDMVNGGGFVTGASGTDYSLQDAAQESGIDGETKNAVYTRLYSATDNFNIAAYVGNIIHITVGTNFTVGWYEITAVGSDGDGDYLDLDRACASANSNNATYYIGGALSLNSTLDDDFIEQLTPGNIVYIKAGTYSLKEHMSSINDGTISAPITIEGYFSTRGDNPTDDDRPFIDSGYQFNSGDYSIVKNIRARSTNTQTLGLGNYSYMINCKGLSVSTITTSIGIFIGNASIAINCEGISNAGYGLQCGLDCLIVGCYIHDCGTAGINFTNDTTSIKACVIENCPTAAYCVSGRDWLNFIGNTFYNGETPTGTGIDYLSTATLFSAVNNIFYGFTTGVSQVAECDLSFLDYNNFYNNTIDVTNVQKGDNTLAVDPEFVNATGTLIEDCEDAWNEYAGTGVTATADNTVYKVGTYSAKAVCDATTGVEVVMTEAISSTDMSGYKGIRCWAYSSVTLTANDWQLLLDDSINCATPIKTLDFPAMTAATWYNVCFDVGDMSSATAIISIGLGQAVDKGAMNFYIDDVRAKDCNFSVGTNLKATSFPGIFSGSSTIGYLDTGAVQRIEPAAGGGETSHVSVF